MSRLEIITPRLVLAMLAYVALGFMAWRTMEDDRIRLVTFAILALFAFKTVLHAVREQQAKQDGSE